MVLNLKVRRLLLVLWPTEDESSVTDRPAKVSSLPLYVKCVKSGVFSVTCMCSLTPNTAQCKIRGSSPPFPQATPPSSSTSHFPPHSKPNCSHIPIHNNTFSFRHDSTTIRSIINSATSARHAQKGRIHSAATSCQFGATTFHSLPVCKHGQSVQYHCAEGRQDTHTSRTWRGCQAPTQCGHGLRP